MEFSAPDFDCTGRSLVEESGVVIWVGDVFLTLSSPVHCVGSNTCRCSDTLARFEW